MRQLVLVEFDGNSFKCSENECYESRGKSVVALVNAAFGLIDEEEKKRLKPFKVQLFLGDKTDSDLGFAQHYPLSFSYSSYHDLLIPCFLFDRWVECGIDDYENVCAEMIRRADQPPIENKLFWIGSCRTNKTRDLFSQITKNDNRILSVDTGRWQKIEGSQRLKTGSGDYVSIPDHCNYKYLIDLQGVGWSARAKMLLHSGRVLFYQSRPWNEYWFFQLKPFEHYIPVENNLSDFYEKFEWAIGHEKECNQIAKNALEFAKKNLRRQNAIERYKNIFLRIGF